MKFVYDLLGRPGESNVIEKVNQDTIDLVLPLIRAYQSFYQCSSIDDEANRAHFSQFGPASDKGCLFVYLDNGCPVGFATVYFTYSSTLPGKVGVMNDLYTVEDCRGRGIGRRLTDHCLHYAKSMGALRLQWLTARGNETAQRLYDSLTSRKSEWYFYIYQDAHV